MKEEYLQSITLHMESNPWGSLLSLEDWQVFAPLLVSLLLQSEIWNLVELQSIKDELRNSSQKDEMMQLDPFFLHGSIGSRYLIGWNLQDEMCTRILKPGFHLDFFAFVARVGLLYQQKTTMSNAMFKMSNHSHLPFQKQERSTKGSKKQRTANGNTP